MYLIIVSYCIVCTFIVFIIQKKKKNVFLITIHYSYY